MPVEMPVEAPTDFVRRARLLAARAARPGALPGLGYVEAAIDRAAEKREDAGFQAAALADPRSQFILFSGLEPFLAECEDGGLEILRLGPLAQNFGTADAAIFLGVEPDGAAVFALAVGRNFDLAQSPIAGLGAFADLRAATPRLSAGESAILATARALIDWRRRHGFCAQCGEPSAAAAAGWKRVCAACGAEHFPRVDPVAIMLAVKGDQCLLGRQSRFPPGMYSALAGFVEPGETVEEACLRELYEEAGVRARHPIHLFAQFWPFPSSLMFGLIAEAEALELRIDEKELEHARWFSRAEALAMIERRAEGLFAPPPLAAAHHLIRLWASE